MICRLSLCSRELRLFAGARVSGALLTSYLGKRNTIVEIC